MTDLRFDDVVDTTHMAGPSGEYVQSVCKTCSKQRKVYRDEFTLDNLYTWASGDGFIPHDVDKDVLRFVAGMRAWNCCHEGDVPLDGFPEEPAAGHVTFESVDG